MESPESGTVPSVGQLSAAAMVSVCPEADLSQRCSLLSTALFVIFQRPSAQPPDATRIQSSAPFGLCNAGCSEPPTTQFSAASTARLCLALCTKSPQLALGAEQTTLRHRWRDGNEKSCEPTVAWCPPSKARRSSVSNALCGLVETSQLQNS